MQEFGKVNSSHVFGLWKNLSVCLLAIVAVLVFSKILPYYLSPVVALVIASLLYIYIYNVRFNSIKTCIVPPISVLYCIVAYAFLTIILNLMHIWGLFEMPHEFIFFTHPFIPTLILNPVSLVVLLIVYFGRSNLRVCKDCRSYGSFGNYRGAIGVLRGEAHLQLRNFIVLSFSLSLIVWLYYQFSYINTNINSRDDYVFTWLTVIGIFLDWLYFSWRYYNLYLDLLENNELISPSELKDLTATTYIRYYVICGDYMYLTEHAVDSSGGKAEVFDTPFFTQQSMNGMLGNDANSLIKKMTGVSNGELRFFYGRKSPEDNKRSLLRFFYFLDGNISDYPELATPGEWVSFDKVKYIYTHVPNKMAELAVYDITRLATIMLTEKIFNEEGFRKNGIKSYSPTFNLLEVRKSNIDFQEDKWIEISLFNSDTSFYKLKKWWRSINQPSKNRRG